MLWRTTANFTNSISRQISGQKQKLPAKVKEEYKRQNNCSLEIPIVSFWIIIANLCMFLGAIWHT